jgi:methionyl-tRNA formyltransferase
MKIIFLGATKFSEEILKFLLSNDINIKAIFTIPENFKISYREDKVRNYNYANLNSYGKDYNIPVYYVDSVKEQKLIDHYQVIKDIDPDLILVMGWYYNIPKKIREVSKLGAWGIHASLLPEYAGGAPLVWAIIEGRSKTGVTLFKLDDGIDDGDIILQEEFLIDFKDTIREVYDKAIEASKAILLRSLKNIDNVKFTAQDKSRIKVYPQRKPEDGEIDFSKSAIEIYNFIRAQSFPYPGAFFRTRDGRKIIIESARIED